MSEYNAETDMRIWGSDGSFIKQFNESQLEILVQLELNGLTDKITLMQSQLLNTIIVKNIEEHFTRIILTIKDRDNLFALKINKNGSDNISFKLKDHSLPDTIKEVEQGLDKFEFNGIITDTEVTSFDPTATVIKVTAISKDFEKFNKIVKYSTGSAYSDVANIMQMLVLSAGYDKNIINQSSIKNSNNKIVFISDNNSTMFDHFEFLLNNIISDTLGYAFFWQSTTDWKFNLIYSKDVSKTAISDTSSYNYLYIPTPEKPRTGDDVVSKTKIYSLTGFKDMLDHYKDTNLILFDLLANNYVVKEKSSNLSNNNKWDFKRVEKTFTDNPDKSLLPSKNSIDLKDVAIDIYKDNSFIYSIANRYDFIKSMRDMFLTRELVAITVPAKTWRNPGEQIFLVDENSNTGGRLSGKWFCNKVVETLDNGKYEQTLFLCRTEANETPKEFGERFSESVNKTEEELVNSVEDI